MSEDEKIDRTPVAQDIWCYSPKEKAFTWHVVINHDAKGFVDRVECKVTKTVHKYKRRTASTTSPSGQKRTVLRPTVGAASSPKAQQSSATLENAWFEGLKKWGEKVIPEYTPQGTYNVRDVFHHATFGKGVVQTKRASKVDVLFKEGLKTLPSK